MEHPVFAAADFEALPPPGPYQGKVSKARLSTSRRGNRMLAVVVHLDDVAPPHDYVTDYFVLEGSTPRGVRTARHRLLRLYHALGLTPAAGDPIEPADLIEGRIEVELGHEELGGEMRLCARRYRRAGESGESLPF